jgi:hypothetical protein
MMTIMMSMVCNEEKQKEVSGEIKEGKTIRLDGQRDSSYELVVHDVHDVALQRHNALDNHLFQEREFTK